MWPHSSPLWPGRLSTVTTHVHNIDIQEELCPPPLCSVTQGQTRLENRYMYHDRPIVWRRSAESTSLNGPFTSRDCDVAATSLPNLIYCFGVVLLHWAFVTVTATNFAVAGESLCDQFGSDVTAIINQQKWRFDFLTKQSAWFGKQIIQSFKHICALCHNKVLQSAALKSTVFACFRLPYKARFAPELRFLFSRHKCSNRFQHFLFCFCCR